MRTYCPISRRAIGRGALDLVFDGVTQIDQRMRYTRTSTATRVNQSGTLQVAAVNSPAIDYNPVTLECRGLLIEPQSTNSVFNSSLLGKDVSVTTGTKIGPDGVLASGILVNAGSVAYPATGSADSQSFANTETTGQSTDYSVSGYVHSLGPLNYQPYIVVLAQDSAHGNQLYALVRFDCSTGTFVSKSFSVGWTEVFAPTAVMQPGGLWKVTWTVRFTQQALLRTSVGHYLQIYNELGQDIYVSAGGSGIQRSCWQFEQCSVATSYIPTTTAQVTRAAPLASMTGSAFSSWYKPESTIAIKFAGQSSGTCTYLCLSDGTPNNRIELQSINGALSLTVVSSGVSTALALGSVTTGVGYTVAAAMGLSSFAASINGAAAVSATSSLPTVDRAHIGMDYAGANVCNSTIKRINVEPVQLSNTQLQDISTL